MKQKLITYNVKNFYFHYNTETFRLNNVQILIYEKNREDFDINTHRFFIDDRIVEEIEDRIDEIVYRRVLKLKKGV